MTDTVPLLFDVMGPRDAPPVLLVHGFPFTRAIWGSTMTALAEDYRVIAPDLRGFGATPAPDTPTSTEDMARDLLALLDQQDVQACTVVGHSMGGYIAFDMLRLAPERVQALALVTTRASADTDAVKASRRKQADLVHLEGVSALAHLLLPKLVAPEPSRTVVEEARRIVEANSPTGLAQALEAMAGRRDATDELSGIRAPTLIVTGATDQVMPREEQTLMEREIPDARFATVNGAGHLPMMEQPDGFTSVLKTFLDETVGAKKA